MNHIWNQVQTGIIAASDVFGHNPETVCGMWDDNMHATARCCVILGAWADQEDHDLLTIGTCEMYDLALWMAQEWNRHYLMPTAHSWAFREPKEKGLMLGYMMVFVQELQQQLRSNATFNPHLQYRDDKQTLAERLFGQRVTA